MGKPTKERSEPFDFTVQGIWEPQDPEAVRVEMRAFSACIRWAFKRLTLPEAREDPKTWRNRLKEEGQRLFHLNSRYVDDAIKQAQEIIDSQTALLPMQLADMTFRIERVEKHERKTLRALKKPDSPDAEKKLSARLSALGRKKTRLQEGANTWSEGGRLVDERRSWDRVRIYQVFGTRHNRGISEMARRELDRIGREHGPSGSASCKRCPNDAS